MKAQKADDEGRDGSGAPTMKAQKADDEGREIGERASNRVPMPMMDERADNRVIEQVPPITCKGEGWDCVTYGNITMKFGRLRGCGLSVFVEPFRTRPQADRMRACCHRSRQVKPSLNGVGSHP